MKPQLSVVKIGGSIIEDQDTLAVFLQLFSELPGQKILVHGGGKHATELSLQLGIEPQLVDGRRITDLASLEVATMVYGGLLNKKIVAKLQQLGCNALGLSGADADSIRAKKRPVQEIDFGFVGDIEYIDTKVIQQLLTTQLVPVFCALTHDGNGTMLNTNADTLASEIAIRMSKRYSTSLLYCFEKPGVLKDLDQHSTLIKELNQEKYRQMISEKQVSKGMLPKLDNCFRALKCGVKEVLIGDHTLLRKQTNIYTTIVL